MDECNLLMINLVMCVTSMEDVQFLKTAALSDRTDDVSYGFSAYSCFWDMFRYSVYVFMVWFWTLGADCLVTPSSHLKLHFKVILFTTVRNVFALCQ